MSQLILIRHGQSLWNAENKFTGWVDIPLSERGRAEATIASCKLREYRVQVGFTSKLKRFGVSARQFVASHHYEIGQSQRRRSS